MTIVSDGWTNILKALGSTAIGSAVTRLYSSTVPIVGDSQWAQLYESDWLARTIVQTYPEEALRKPPTILDEDEAEVDRLWSEFDRLNSSELYPHGVLMQGLCQGRALAGSAILLGFRYGRPDTPAPPIGPRSELVWLDVCPWEWLSVASRDTDPNSPRFGLPATLRVNGPHARAGLVMHASRMIVCEGIPRAKVESQELHPWLSVLQPVYDVMQRYGLSWEGTSVLLQEASVGVLKMAGLTDLLAAKDEESIQGRMRLMSEGRSSARTVFLDAETGEDFSRTEVSFSGLSTTLEQLERQICGAARIPATKIFRRSPAGMNATGESDIRMFYDDVSVYQRTSVAPKMVRLFSLIAGRPVELDFPPLWEVTEKERAEIRALDAETDGRYYDLGILDPADILRSRSADGSLGIEVEDVDARIRTMRASPPAAPSTEGRGVDVQATVSRTEQTDQPEG